MKQENIKQVEAFLVQNDIQKALDYIGENEDNCTFEEILDLLYKYCIDASGRFDYKKVKNVVHALDECDYSDFAEYLIEHGQRDAALEVFEEYADRLDDTDLELLVKCGTEEAYRMIVQHFTDITGHTDYEKLGYFACDDEAFSEYLSNEYFIEENLVEMACDGSVWAYEKMDELGFVEDQEIEFFLKCYDILNDDHSDIAYDYLENLKDCEEYDELSNLAVEYNCVREYILCDEELTNLCCGHKWFKKACSQGNDVAIQFLIEHTEAIILYKESFEWLEKTAQTSQYPEFAFVLASIYLGEKEDIEINTNNSLAARWLKKAASMNYVPAMLRLAECYETGTGVKKNTEEQLVLLQQAVKEGSTFLSKISGDFKSQYSKLLKDAEYKIAENKEAYDLLDKLDDITKKAEAGDVGSLMQLAQIYETGKCVDTDYVKALELYEKAFSLGCKDAEQKVSARIYLQYASYYWEGNKHNGISQSLQKGIKLYRIAAKKGDAEAQYLLGYYITKGWGCRKNWNAGMRWIRKAAKNGNEDAQAYLDKKDTLFNRMIHKIIK